MGGTNTLSPVAMSPRQFRIVCGLSEAQTVCPRAASFPAFGSEPSHCCAGSNCSAVRPLPMPAVISSTRESRANAASLRPGRNISADSRRRRRTSSRSPSQALPIFATGPADRTCSWSGQPRSRPSDPLHWSPSGWRVKTRPEWKDYLPPAKRNLLPQAARRT